MIYKGISCPLTIQILPHQLNIAGMNFHPACSFFFKKTESLPDFIGSFKFADMTGPQIHRHFCFWLQLDTSSQSGRPPFFEFDVAKQSFGSQFQGHLVIKETTLTSWFQNCFSHYCQNVSLSLLNL